MIRAHIAAALQRVVDVLDAPAARARREAAKRADLALALAREVERTQHQTPYVRRLKALR